MSGRNAYGTTAKALHWMIVVLLILQYVIGWIMPDIQRGMQPGTPMNLHISIGFLVLVLIVARFFWRIAHPVEPASSLPPWQRVSSEGVHWLLYVLVIATTLTGWVFASMRGWTITLFWTVPLPGLVEDGSTLGRSIGRLHETLTWVLLVIIGMHVLAAFVHLFIYRDRVVERMLLGR